MLLHGLERVVLCSSCRSDSWQPIDMSNLPSQELCVHSRFMLPASAHTVRSDLIDNYITPPKTGSELFLEQGCRPLLVNRRERQSGRALREQRLNAHPCRST